MAGGWMCYLLRRALLTHSATAPTVSRTHMSWPPGESSIPPYTMPTTPSATTRMATTTYFMGSPIREGGPAANVAGELVDVVGTLLSFRYVVRRGGSFLDPLQQVTGLAVEHPAHSLQGAETN